MTPFNIACIWFPITVQVRLVVTLCLKCTVFEMDENHLKPTTLSFGTLGVTLPNFRRVIPCQKVKSWSYQVVYISRSCFRSAGQNTSCNRRTDTVLAQSCACKVARVKIVKPKCTVLNKCLATFREIWRLIGPKIAKNAIPLSQIALAGGDPLRIFGRVIAHQRPISMGYQMVKKS